MADEVNGGGEKAREGRCDDWARLIEDAAGEMVGGGASSPMLTPRARSFSSFKKLT
jgi:hypothetical protein